MEKLTRVLLIALAAVMLLAAGSSASPAQATAEEPIEIRFLFDMNQTDTGGVSLQDNRYVDYIQEVSGYKVVMESAGGTGGSYIEKLNILLASGNRPDVFQVQPRNNIMSYAADGILADLAPYIYSDDYQIQERMPARAWAPVTEGEHIWAFPYNRQDAMNQTFFIRKAWMENLDLEIPKTVEEFYEVMRAFTYDDPDQNGLDDTFGLISERDLGYTRAFQAAFGASEYRIIDGKVTPPEVTEEYRDYLEYMHRLASEGILDNEVFTYNTQIFQDKLKEEKHGMLGEFWHFGHAPEYFMPDDSRPFGNKIPDVWMVVDFPLNVKTGEKTYNIYSSTNRHYMCISATSDKIADVMGFFDWCISDEGTKFDYLGVPGIEYSEENGVITPLAEKQLAQWMMLAPVKQGNLREGIEKLWMAGAYDPESIIRLEHSRANGKMDYIAAMLPFNSDLQLANTWTLTEEYRAKAILGTANLTTDWDAYINDWYAMGGQEIIDFYTEWYDTIGKDMVAEAQKNQE